MIDLWGSVKKCNTACNVFAKVEILSATNSTQSDVDALQKPQ